MPASARMARCGAGGSGSASTSGRTGAEAAAAALPLAVRGRRMSLSSSSSLLLPRSSSSSSGIKRRFACRATGDDAQNERIKTTLADLDALLGIQEEPKAADKVRRLCTHQTPPIRGSSMSTYRGADACMLQGLGGGAALHKTPRRARRAAAVAHAVRCALRAARRAPHALCCLSRTMRATAQPLQPQPLLIATSNTTPAGRGRRQRGRRRRGAAVARGAAGRGHRGDAAPRRQGGHGAQPRA